MKMNEFIKEYSDFKHVHKTRGDQSVKRIGNANEIMKEYKGGANMDLRYEPQ